MLKKKRSILSLSNISFISPAEWLFKKVKNEFNLSNIVLVPNGVDPNVFKPAADKSDLRKKYNLPLNKKIVLFSANNLRDKNKGGSYFLKLVETFRHNPDYIFCLVGSSRLPRVKNLISLGYISDAKKMAEIYALADLYCFFSAAETSPLSVLEATACGLPILAFKIKALEYLLFGEGNLLVEYGNTGLMLESFKKFFSSDYSPTKKNSALSRPDEMFSSYREVYLASF
jgi:glycosyltransferase involved in cell wall biosynthesis